MGAIYSLLGWNDSGTPDEVTGLTNRENKILQASWAKIMENSLENGMVIMMSFFNKYPEYIKLFPFKDVPLEKLKEDVRFKVHCNTIMYNLSQVINNLGHSELIIGILDKIAANHVKHGATAKGFQDIKGVILDILDTLVSKEAYELWKQLLEVAMNHIAKQLT